MIRIAIVDDDCKLYEMLCGYITRYCTTQSLSFETTYFADGAELIMNYTPVYDVIFLDIKMERMDGMTAAHKLREFDPEVLLIFITQMAQFALAGYRVEALDFLVKPVRYPQLEMVLRKVVLRLSTRPEGSITLIIDDIQKVVPLSIIYAVEVWDHYLVYHLETGDVKVKGRLSDAAAQFPTRQFFQCSRHCIVNLKFVTDVGKDYVTVMERNMEVSRSRRKELVHALNAFHGGILS